MKYFLDGILPRIVPDDVSYITIPHEGKSDLQKSIPKKLKGWTAKDAKFVIVQDQDANDCRELKQKLLEHQQISGAQKIAEYIDVEYNQWASFQIFVKGVRELCQTKGL